VKAYPKFLVDDEVVVVVAVVEAVSDGAAISGGT
jgi:hypothetical protein